MKFLLLALFSFTVAAKDVHYISLPEIKKVLTCAAPLVSHWIQERDYAYQVEVRYGPYLISRTDVGKSGGNLIVAQDKKLLCNFTLDLTPDIYLSLKDNLLVTSSYTGSSKWFNFYDLKNNCKSLGQNNEKDLKEVIKLLDEHDGNRTCKR